MNKLISGGAIGADAYFAECADQAGHDIVHYSFAKHKVKGPGSVVELDTERLESVDKYIRLCNNVLGRTIDGMSTFSWNLLRRSMIKVIDNDYTALYAVTYLNEDLEITGGTAWATTIFDLLGKGDIYVFNQANRVWYQKVLFEGMVPCEKDLKVSGTYLGIGSRELSNEGKTAISDLYG